MSESTVGHVDASVAPRAEEGAPSSAHEAAVLAVLAIPGDESVGLYPEASAWADGYNAALERVRDAISDAGATPRPVAERPTSS